MTMVGAVMAPRWSYLTPNFVFNPMISFQVVIMALLGGMQRLWGPVLGVVPLILLSEFLSTTFPRAYASCSARSSCSSSISCRTASRASSNRSGTGSRHGASASRGETVSAGGAGQ